MMHEFYKKSLLVLIVLLLADAQLAAFCLYQSHPTYRLSPGLRHGVRWVVEPVSDAIDQHGTTSLQVRASGPDTLVYDFRLTKVATYPFAGVRIGAYDPQGKPALVDLSRYDTITFVARCTPAEPLSFSISAFDDKVSKPGDLLTYRSPGTFFSCNEHGVPVSLDLRRMTIPYWWFALMKLSVSNGGYALEKVGNVTFGSTSQTPFDTDAHVEISNITLHGYDRRYIVALVIIVLAGIIAFTVWFFRTHAWMLAASLTSQMKKDLPLVAYRQLTAEPYRDKEKASVLKFIATNYTDPELDLDSVVAGTGANRNKVNDLLKSELGMTFTGYLNKLRLTEAARLLIEKSAATVAEVAYSVGYANVSYFNKLFKEEYGCTPKAFRTLAPQQAPSAEAASVDTPPP